MINSKKNRISGKNVLLIIVILFNFSAFGQLTTQQPSIERKGFIFGFGIDGGMISLTDSSQENPFDEVQGNIGFPNLKFGWMVTDRLAILGTLPSMNYEYEGKDRSFKAFTPAIQYWIKDRWWVNGGFGLAMDFPALYEVDDTAEEDWNFGYTFTTSTGFELIQKKRYAFDLQTKLYYGKTYLDNDEHREALVVSIGLGFNWY